jgi:hypothetical protein
LGRWLFQELNWKTDFQLPQFILVLHLNHNLDSRGFVTEAAGACGMTNRDTSFTVRGGLLRSLPRDPPVLVICNS